MDAMHYGCIMDVHSLIPLQNATAWYATHPLVVQKSGSPRPEICSILDLESLFFYCKRFCWLSFLVWGCFRAICSISEQKHFIWTLFAAFRSKYISVATHSASWSTHIYFAPCYLHHVWLCAGICTILELRSAALCTLNLLQHICSLEQSLVLYWVQAQSSMFKLHYLKSTRYMHHFRAKQCYLMGTCNILELEICNAHGICSIV
jgi:hypothetical protein